jgi:hypothetical protein
MVEWEMSTGWEREDAPSLLREGGGERTHKKVVVVGSMGKGARAYNGSSRVEPTVEFRHDKTSKVRTVCKIR